MVRLLSGADLLAEQVVDPVEGPVVPPLVEIAPDGALGGQVAGQVAPLAAGAEDVEDGVEDVPHPGLARPPAAGLGREVRLDQVPLGIGDVAGIVMRSHPSSTTLRLLMSPLWDRLSIRTSIAASSELIRWHAWLS